MINYIQIFGERNSGTNYLENLLANNLKDNIEIGPKFGWKHGFTNRKKIINEDTSKVLFIVITKDPYSWIVSMNKRPHHAPQLYFLGLSEFIKKEWACYKGKGYNKRARKLHLNPLTPDEEMMQERNPKSGARIRNVIKLRNLKNEYYLKIQNIVENIEYVRYIDLLLNPIDKLKEICSKYEMDLVSKMQNPSGHYGKNPNKISDKLDFYENQEYLNSFSQEDLKYVNMHLDFDIEKTLGYGCIKNLN